jgi:hypothetical protein
MKKILRLVTTSVLTLTLVACGEASSSVSSSVSSTPASSVSSTTSAFANVSTITLSAASDTLTQTLGTQKAVVVQAALNANTNPSLALEWFVNGTKSNQTGRVFEYTPATSGTFVISARVGSVLSNNITLTVGAGSFAVESAKFVDNNTIEIKAPGGATVAVTGNEVLDTSKYDLKLGTYIVDLKTALKQGDSATVTLTREGNQTVTRIVTFDTREIKAAVASAKDNKDGTFDITRPHELNASTGVLNTASVTYTVVLNATNMKADQQAFKLERVSAPADAAAFTTSEGLTNVAGDKDSAAGQFTFTVTRSTTPGNYVYRYTLNGVVSNVTLVVKDTVAEVELKDLKNTWNEKALDGTTNVTAGPHGGIALGTLTGDTDNNGTVAGDYLRIYDSEALFHAAAGDADDLKYNSSTKTYNLVYKPSNQAFLVGVPANTDGSFDIVKEYLPIAGAFKEFYFKLDGDLFRVPTNLAAQAGVLPNQAQLTLTGPDGNALMRTQYVTQTSLPTLSEGFRIGFNMPPVRQLIDASTPVGKYTYTLRVLQLGSEIFKQEVVVNVKAAEEKATLVARVNDQSDAFAVAKTLFENKLSFPLITTTVGGGAAGALVAVNNDAADFAAAKSLYETNWLTKTSYPTTIQPFNFTTYTAARNAFVTEVLTDLPFMTITSANAYATGTVVADLEDFKEAIHQYVSPYAVATYTSGAIATLTDTQDAAIFAAGGSIAFSNYLAGLLITLLEAQPASTDVDTETEFNAAKAKYEANVAKLFPTYEEFVNNSAKKALVAGADGVYVIQKPFASALDTKSVVFDLTLENFESKVNAAASVDNSYLVDGVKRELVPFIKSVSGPGQLENQAFNTANTKIAIELNKTGSVQSIASVSTQEATPKSYVSYLAPTWANSKTLGNKVTIPSVAVLDVQFLTVNGEYTFNVAVGPHSKTITVRVVLPTPKVTFGLVPNDATNLALGYNDFTYNATEDKYYATLGKAPATVAGDRVEFRLQLQTENIAVPTSGDNANKLAYTFVRTTPLISETKTDFVLTSAVAGNDGKRIVDAANDDGIISGALDAEEATDNGAEVGSIPGLNVSAAILRIRTKGTYVYDLTIGGVRKVVTLVVEEYPTMKDLKVTIGTTAATSFGSNFLIPDGTLAFKVDGTAVNLPSGLFYSLSLGTTGVDHNIDAADANTEDIAKIKTGANTGGFNSKDGTPKSIRPLNLANGINVQLVKDTVASPNINSEFQLDTDSTIENKLLYVQVTFFKAVEIATFDPLNPLFDLEYVGHDTVQLWYAPINVPSVSTISTHAKASDTTSTFVLQASVPSVAYYLAQEETGGTTVEDATFAAVPTLETLLLTGTAIDLATANTNVTTTLTLTTDKFHRVVYVVIAKNTSNASAVTISPVANLR